VTEVILAVNNVPPSLIDSLKTYEDIVSYRLYLLSPYKVQSEDHDLDRV